MLVSKRSGLVLFKNKNKEHGSKQPDYYGHYDPGDSTKLHGRSMLSATSLTISPNLSSTRRWESTRWPIEYRLLYSFQQGRQATRPNERRYERS